MPSDATEAELCDVVVAELRKTGWKAVCEIPFYERRIDIVAAKAGILMCVEVKKTFTSGLLHQAKSCQTTADWVYCAIGSNATDATKKQLLNTGIGLWQVIGKEIVCHQHPYSRDPVAVYKAKLMSSIANASESTRGGLPSGPESGYLRAIAVDVATFKTENPTATWQQIYDGIKSPYSSSANLYSALRKHGIRQFRSATRNKNDGGSFTQ